MRRRLTLSMVATVLVTLLVVGVTTFAIARWQARATTERDLRAQSETIVAALVAGAPNGAGAPEAQRTLAAMRRAMRLEGVEIITVGPSGEPTGRLPDGVARTDLDLADLRRGQTQSGHHGSVSFAAAAETVRQVTVVVVVTATSSTRLGQSVRWFGFAAVITLIAGTLVGVVVGRRLSRPIRSAGEAARRIAAGDLSTRLPEPAGGADDEVAQLHRSINSMAAGLERARTLDQQFLLSVSHDLRTPLTAIRGHAEAILDGVAERPADSAAVITRAAERLDRLVGDLLDLARLDANTFSLSPTSTDAGELVTAAAAEFAAAADRHGLDVDLDVATGPLLVTADGNRLRQVLHNLLDNAAKYADRRIVVSVARASDGSGGAEAVVVTIDDDGPGIAPDDVAHVFERLYVARARPVRAEVGSGLGLAIVRQLTEAMGASVSAGRAPSGGARFQIRFPPAAPAP